MKGDKALQPKGTRDFSPDVMSKRNWIIDRIRNKFQKFGFRELQTPALENLSVLLGKYGEDGDKLVFKILNSGKYLPRIEERIDDKLIREGEETLTPHISEKGLRYDLTVPFARYIAKNHRELSFPFKRFQIQPVWRADRPQKGRFREFLQCDADTVGSYSNFADAELIVLAHEILESLGIKKFQFFLNHRKFLNGFCSKYAGAIPVEKVLGVLDKKDKIGTQKVLELLKETGISKEGLDGFEQILDFNFQNVDSLTELENLANGNDLALLGIGELKDVFEKVNDLKLPNFSLYVNPSLARGLDYYTGSIFEIVIPNSGLGSICGGGRYDDLTGIFGVSDIPGVGLSFGVDRIYEYMESSNLFLNAETEDRNFLICHLDEKSLGESWKLLSALRKAGCRGSMFPELDKLKKQIQYADRNGFQNIIILGPEELETQSYKIKNLKSGDQKSLSIGDLIKLLNGKD